MVKPATLDVEDAVSMPCMLERSGVPHVVMEKLLLQENIIGTRKTKSYDFLIFNFFNLLLALLIIALL